MVPPRTSLRESANASTRRNGGRVYELSEFPLSITLFQLASDVQRESAASVPLVHHVFGTQEVLTASSRAKFSRCALGARQGHRREAFPRSTTSPIELALGGFALKLDTKNSRRDGMLRPACRRRRWHIYTSAMPAPLQGRLAVWHTGQTKSVFEVATCWSRGMQSSA